MLSRVDKLQSQPSAAMSSVKLVFVGDICLGGGLQESLRRHGCDFPFVGTKSALEDADIVVGNLECCIVDSVSGEAPAHNVMKIPSSLASGLLSSGINVVALSNNHILDGGANGLASTRQFLDANQIRHFGAGLNLADAELPLIMECNGIKLAFLGACDAPTVYASPTAPGVPSLARAGFRRRIAECKKHADIVIVSLHADLEFSPYPAPGRVRLSRWLVDEGADLVIQHHPHVCQGVETYRHGLIAYSLGNFVFRVKGNDYLTKRNGTDWGLVLRVEIALQAGRKDIAYEPKLVSIDSDNKTVCSTGDRLEEQMLLLNKYSQALCRWPVLRRARMARCLDEARMNVFGIYYTWRRKGIAEAFRSGVRTLRSPYERRWMYGLLSFGWF